ncbi:glycoside hydrolase family 26 protein [Chelativorans xinjiangense]|uniref:glycoside hydrolase family 26 protein n=1 Tax=Chelativorans xinjiangense TaxID=2681485 RepID=UPI001357227E|nr:glycoside hydrolase family 26 protein [Chelativorans xinjiangense]
MSRTSKTAALSAAAILASGVVFAANSPRGIPDPNSTTAGTPSDKRPVITPSSISFGAYDPHGDFGEDPNSTIEHLFLPWEDVDLSTLTIADEYALARGRSLLISVEPWSWDRDWRVSSEELYRGIVSGRYDANAAAVCSEVAKLKSPATVRFAQEMDEQDNQFTWAQWSGPEYISAYRRFVTECRKHLANAEFMWSPKGNADLQDYYPGDDVVDVIGLSVFGYQPYDREKTGRDQTFAERLAPGYNLVKDYGKAIVVAELGYEGDQAYVRQWAEAVTKRHAEFPELTAVVYFNDREVYPWPDDFGLPNWRVVEESTN